MIIYGRNTVKEALISTHKSDRLILEENIKKENSKIAEIINLAYLNNIPIDYASRKVLDKLAKNNEHQGVCLEVSFTNSKLSDIDFSDNNSLKSFIYISEATYEHNIGSIIRSAECVGLDGVIIPKDIKVSPTILKISTGAGFHIPIYNESIFQAIKLFKDNGYTIIGIERNGQKYSNINLKQNTLFIIGGEDKSLSENVRNECHYIAEIPQKGKINSLNMSVAASVVLFEQLRQKNTVYV